MELLQAAAQPSDSVPSWVPVATTVLGFLVGIGAEWLRALWAVQQRKAQRAEAKADRRDDRQLETIDSLQKWIYELALSTRDFIYEEEHSPEHNVSIELLNRVEAAQANITTNRVRLLDADGRNLVDDFRKTARDALDHPQPLQQAMKAIQASHDKANERLGGLYRAILEED